MFHVPLASCATTMEKAIELVHSRHVASIEFGAHAVTCDAAHSNTWKVLGVALFDAAKHEDGMRALRSAQRLSPWHIEHVYAYLESLRAVSWAASASFGCCAICFAIAFQCHQSAMQGPYYSARIVRLAWIVGKH